MPDSVRAPQRDEKPLAALSARIGEILGADKCEHLAAAASNHMVGLREFRQTSGCARRFRLFCGCCAARRAVCTRRVYEALPAYCRAQTGPLFARRSTRASSPAPAPAPPHSCFSSMRRTNATLQELTIKHTYPPFCRRPPQGCNSKISVRLPHSARQAENHSKVSIFCDHCGDKKPREGFPAATLCQLVPRKNGSRLRSEFFCSSEKQPV